MDRLLYSFTLVVLLVWKFALSKEDFLSYFLTRSNLWESPPAEPGVYLNELPPRGSCVKAFACNGHAGIMVYQALAMRLKAMVRLEEPIMV